MPDDRTSRPVNFHETAQECSTPIAHLTEEISRAVRAIAAFCVLSDRGIMTVELRPSSTVTVARARGLAEIVGDCQAIDREQALPPLSAALAMAMTARSFRDATTGEPLWAWTVGLEDGFLTEELVDGLIEALGAELGDDELLSEKAQSVVDMAQAELDGARVVRA